MEFADLPYCLARVGPWFWSSIVAVVVAGICAMVCRRRKAIIAAELALVFGGSLALQWPGVAMRWQLGLLGSESSQANERAYAVLKNGLTPTEIWRIVRNEREDPNVRFALALMLHERDEEWLLESTPVAPLQKPIFFGRSHLQEAAGRLSFPLEVRELSERLMEFPSPLLQHVQRTNDALDEFHEFGRAQEREFRATSESR